MRSTRLSTTPMTIPARIPIRITPSRAPRASQKSATWARQSRVSFRKSIIPETAWITIAPSTASGRSSKTLARKRIVSTTKVAVTRNATGVFAPASPAAADFERLPVGVYPWRTPAPMLAAP